MIKNTLTLYPAAQALGASAAPIVISLAGLVSISLGAHKDIATLPIFLLNAGMAVSTLIAAYSIKTLGRKTAYIIAATVALLGAGLQTAALLHTSFLLFCIGTTMLGFNAAHIQTYRFAVMEGQPTHDHGKAISRVMLGGLVAAIIGPQIVVWGGTLASGQFIASFGGIGVLLVLQILILSGLPRSPAQSRQQHQQPKVSIWTLLSRPTYVTAMLAGVVSYALMAFVMTAAPIAMVSHGHPVSDAALGIQWHVLAMYAPSFFTGKLIERFGKATITAIGLLFIALSGGLALMGLDLMHFWGTLILLGLGWNFGFTGATALIATSVSDEEKSVAQGLNDFMIFTTMAIGSLMAGFMFNSIGWQMLNLVVFPGVAIALAMMLLHRAK
ncbi:MAG TPA: MFS transporter [Pseudomonadales bacterium]|nr:MFS transporter [Pseudomonadales bacterium]